MSRTSMPSRIFGTVMAHGMRGRMLSKTELQTLAESRDVDELVTRIKNTVYLDALAKVSKPYTAEKIEGALREYQVNLHSKMLSVTGGSSILSAYFLKYVIWNLKIVLKGKALSKSYEELVPKVNLRAEELLGRRDIIVKALVSKNLDEAIGALAGSDVAEDAAKAAAIYKDKRDLRVFDTYLDRTFFTHLGRGMNAESQSLDVKNIVSTDIDSYNILAVLRGKFWGLAPNDISDLVVTTTSKVTRDTLMKMINTEKISEAIGELGNTVYKEIIPQTFTSDIDAIMQLENGFEAIELKRVVSAFRSMFNLGIMVAALKLLMIEVRNLSAIASGVEQKVPTEAIVSRLIIPT